MDIDLTNVTGPVAWLPDWLLAHASLWSLGWPLLCSGLVTVAIAWHVATRPRLEATAMRAPLLLLLASAGVVLSWLASAPAVRFATPHLAALGASALTVSYAILSQRWPARRVFIALNMTIAFMLADHVDNFLKWFRVLHPPVIQRTLYQPPLEQFVTATGTLLWVPATEETCWAAPLPCTPYPTARLTLRTPGNLASGFAIVPFDEQAIVGWWTPEAPWWERLKR